MANREQLEILEKGVEFWNRWRAGNAHASIDLSGAYLDGVVLPQVNLRGAKLNGADLRWASLNGADLTGADLVQAHIMGTDLRQANLVQADLRQAHLRAANLTGSHLSKAIVDNTIFVSLDLSEANGLEEVLHYGPSAISTDVFAYSKGRIPEVFLRGCGLSEWEVEFVKLYRSDVDPEQVAQVIHRLQQLYIGDGIQSYYSCFISYNSKDEAFAKQLHNDLQNNSVRCWFAPEDMKIGDQIRPRIDQEIRLRDKLLVILSENSVQSEWVGDEVEAALEEESKSKRLVLFPIRLDDAVMSTRDDWAAKIKRRRHIGDFSNWKDKASYQKAFERLLRDLKATGGDVDGE